MKKLFIYSLMALVLPVAMSSCKKDKEAPSITITSPENHSHHAKGGTIHVEATFEDDRELANYHVHIGDIDGNHTSDFHFEDEADITGTSYDFHTMITVPSEIGMVYYLHFEVADAEGQKTTDKIMLHFD